MTTSRPRSPGAERRPRVADEYPANMFSPRDCSSVTWPRDVTSEGLSRFLRNWRRSATIRPVYSSIGRLEAHSVIGQRVADGGACVAVTSRFKPKLHLYDLLWILLYNKLWTCRCCGFVVDLLYSLLYSKSYKRSLGIKDELPKASRQETGGEMSLCSWPGGLANVGVRVKTQAKKNKFGSIPSVLWHCWVGHRKRIHACKKNLAPAIPIRFFCEDIRGIRPNLEWSVENRPVKQKTKVCYSSCSSVAIRKSMVAVMSLTIIVMAMVMVISDISCVNQKLWFAWCPIICLCAADFFYKLILTWSIVFKVSSILTFTLQIGSLTLPPLASRHAKSLGKKTVQMYACGNTEAMPVAKYRPLKTQQCRAGRSILGSKRALP